MASVLLMSRVGSLWISNPTSNSFDAFLPSASAVNVKIIPPVVSPFVSAKSVALNSTFGKISACNSKYVKSSIRPESAAASDPTVTVPPKADHDKSNVLVRSK